MSNLFNNWPKETFLFEEIKKREDNIVKLYKEVINRLDRIEKKIDKLTGLQLIRGIWR